MQYVLYKLLSRNMNREKSRGFFKCLGNMTVVGKDCDPNFLAYTRLWFERINRGRLFFSEIEKLVLVMLPRHMAEADSKHSVKEVIY
jgi:hypothetical protein